MTNSAERPSSPEPEQSPRPRYSRRLRPWVIGSVVVGSGVLAAGVFGYREGSRWLQTELPPLLETQLRKTINRDVHIGSIEEVSLTGVRLGPSLIPPAPGNPNSLSIPSIKIHVDPLQVLLKGLSSRTLPVEITIAKLRVYAQQDKQGKWINLNLTLEKQEPTELPVNLDTTIRLQDAEVVLLPQGQTRPLTIPIDATAQYYQSRDNRARYDAKLKVAGSQIDVQGKTILKTGSSQVNARIDKFAIAQFAPLIPTDTVKLTSGELNANLKLDLPTSTALPSVFGQVRLQNFQARVATLTQPVKANAVVAFAGKTLRLGNAGAQVGALRAQVGGSINWHDGLERTRLNLDLDVPAVELASIKQTLLVPVPIQLTGTITANARVRGTIKQPKLTAGLQTTKPSQIDKVAFNRIQASVVGDRKRIQLTNFQAAPSAGGQIQAQGQVRLPTNLAQLDLMQLPLTLDVNANLPAGAIAADYGVAPTLKLGQVIAQAKLRGTGKQPQFQGKLQTTQPSQIDKVAFNRIQARVVGDRKRIQLTNFQAVPSAGGQIQAQGQVRLPPNLAQLDLMQLPLALNFQADLPANAIATAYALDTAIKPGQVVAQGQVRGTLVNPQALLTWQAPSAYADAIGAVAGRGTVAVANRTIQVKDTQLRTKGGIITAAAQGNLDTTQWQAAVDARDVNVRQLPLATATTANGVVRPATLAAAPLNGRLRLSGEFAPFIKPQPTVTVIRADDLAVTWGQQSLQARGIAQLYPPTKPRAAWDAAVALNIAANADFNTLPINRLVQQALAAQPITMAPKVKGQANFRGRIVAANLLTNPLGSAQSNLTGNITLRNFAVNQFKLDPTITGPINVNRRQGAIIDLRGQTDRIAATLAPCTQERCRIPYLPTGFDIRLGSHSADPLLVQGQRTGDRFVMSVRNIELASLGLAVAQPFGISGVLGGRVDSNLDVNLYTLKTQGEVQVNQPGIGEIHLDQVATRFAYADGQAQVSDGQIAFGQSYYKFAGGVNLSSGAVRGKVTLSEGYIQDLMALLAAYQQQKISAAGAQADGQAPVYAQAATVQTKSVGEPNAALIDQLQALAQAQANLPPAEPTIEQASLSPFDAQGKYTGELTVAGTLSNPEAAFLFQGERWQLRRASAVVAQKTHQSQNQTSQDQGLTVTQPRDQQPLSAGGASPLPVIDQPQNQSPSEEKPTLRDRGTSQITDATDNPPKPKSQPTASPVTIDKILAQGKLENGILTLQPVRVEMNGGVFGLKGKFSPTQLAGSFQLDDFAIAPIAQLAALPVDLQGILTLDGQLAGSPQQPQVKGKVGIVNGSINGETLKPIQGGFRYADNYLNFATTQPSYLQVNANVPLPLGAELASDTFTLDATVGSPTFRLLGAITQDQIVWSSGEGNLQLKAEGRLNIPNQIFGLKTAVGQLSLKNANIQAVALKNPLRLDGSINFENDRFRIDRLEGGFAQNSKLLITGVLPLLFPLSPEDPDSERPLTVAIDQQPLDVQELYQGELEGNVQVTGSLLVPVVSGRLQLLNGEVLIPRQAPSNPMADAKTDNGPGNSTLTNQPETTQFALFSPTVKDFQLILGPKLSARLQSFTDIRLAADVVLPTLRPLARVQAAGAVTVNGPIADLRPEGTITVESAWFDILNTAFSLDQNSPNTITFLPEQGLLNPNLDITVTTVASEANEGMQRETSGDGNQEIREDIVPNSRPEEIDVFLKIKGPLALLMPTESTRICLPRNTQTVQVTAAAYTSEELAALGNCLNQSVRESSSDVDTSLLSSPIISLRSVPERGQSQIIAIFGNQFTNAIQDNLDRDSEFSFVTFAATQYILRPLAQDAVATIRRWGQGIGLLNLRVIPTLRATRQVGPNAFLDWEYDYGYSLSPSSRQGQTDQTGAARVMYRISF